MTRKKFPLWHYFCWWTWLRHRFRVAVCSAIVFVVIAGWIVILLNTSESHNIAKNIIISSSSLVYYTTTIKNNKPFSTIYTDISDLTLIGNDSILEQFNHNVLFSSSNSSNDKYLINENNMTKAGRSDIAKHGNNNRSDTHTKAQHGKHLEYTNLEYLTGKEKLDKVVSSFTLSPWWKPRLEFRDGYERAVSRLINANVHNHTVFQEEYNVNYQTVSQNVSKIKYKHSKIPEFISNKQSTLEKIKKENHHSNLKKMKKNTNSTISPFHNSTNIFTFDQLFNNGQTNKRLLNRKVSQMSSNWDKILSKRQSQVQEVCRRHKMVLKRLYSHNTLLWDTIHHVAYCRNAKAGTTTWLQQMLQLSNITVPQSYTAEDIHQEAMKIFHPIGHVDALKELLNKDAVLFTVVRHPFTRLVSAYRDKIQSGYRKDLQEEMISKYRTINLSINSTNKPELTNQNIDLNFKQVNNSQSIPTFSEFIKYVTRKIINCHANEINSVCLKDLDVHWMPMFERCDPCYFNYNIISKVETFKDDLNYIKHLFIENKNDSKPITKASQTNMELSDKMDVPILNASKGNSTAKIAKTYFNMLTSNDKEDINKAYIYDFLLFGYKPNIF